jgi:acyl-CoA hydrolase
MPEGGKKAKDSQVIMTEIVMPEDTNPHNRIWGGRVMGLIDKAAAIAAMRHARANVVTAAVDSLVFQAPAGLGHILRLHASVNATFNSSMEVGVKVVSEDPHSGAQALCCKAYVTMVALGPDGRPTRVARVLATTAEERRRERDARLRRRVRLAARTRRRSGSRR